MVLLLQLAFIASALGAAVNIERATSPQALSVELESSGNSAVKATITNTGPEPLRLYTPGSLLDDSPIEKTEVFSGSNPVPFNGIRLHLITTNIKEDAFRTIGANESIQAEWDPAEVHDLSAGGRFDYRVSGQFLVAAPNSTVITGSILFNGTLSSEINGTTASGIHQGYQAQIKRTTMGEFCTPDQTRKLRAAEKACNEMALKAAKATELKTSGAKHYLTKYFKSADAATRTAVEEVFQKTAFECTREKLNVKGPSALMHCDNTRKACKGHNYAYTIPKNHWIAYCPEYFDELRLQTTTCHQNDRALTTLHEVTHLTEVKGTKDHVYNYPAVTKLNRTQALDNADSYALFAKAIDLECHGGLGPRGCWWC